MSEYKWQNRCKYGTPVEFADDQHATQVVNACESLASVLVQLAQTELAYKLSPNRDVRNKCIDIRRNAAVIRADIRWLAKGQIV